MKLDKLKSLIPFSEIEQEAQHQIYDNLAHDFMLKMAIMPDVHAGYDLPVGGVALLDGKISPSYVGYDIGCGMCFVRTPLKADELTSEALQNIFDSIYKVIPVGFNIRERGLDYKAFQSASEDKELNKRVIEKLEKSLGTLGGGNHFIEIGKDQKGFVCVTIHSGSRNIGHSIAEFYMKKARFLDVSSELGNAYLEDMNFALDFALVNRLTMMQSVLKIMGLDYLTKKIIKESLVNENHNHAIVTEEGVLHRKGATPADVGQLGIIPANMRDGVYITKGLGNKEFLSSASHGAGRTMSRSKAKKMLDMELFHGAMKGVVAKVEESTFDESPFVYKNIDTVLAYQEGVAINVVDKITPMVNVKASGK